MGIPKTDLQKAYEGILKELQKIPVRDAVFNNNDVDTSKVVEVKHITKLIDKYFLKIKKINPQ